jgi:hypothetical protein
MPSPKRYTNDHKIADVSFSRGWYRCTCGHEGSLAGVTEHMKENQKEKSEMPINRAFNPAINPGPKKNFTRSTLKEKK